MKADLFNSKAKVYDAARPKYAGEMMAFLKNHEGLEGKKIADVGAGTGIFSRQLRELGNEIFAVEPNDEMRRIAAERMSGQTGFTILKGIAESTGLADNSVDAVCAAQAFHWFDHRAFAKECRRILRGGGKVYLTWNNNSADNEDDDKKECNDIVDRYCAQNQKFSTHDSHKVFDDIDDFYQTYEIYKFDNPIARSKETFLQMVLSASYALRPEDAEYDNFVRELSEYFDRRNQNGYIISKNVSVLYVGQPKE